MITYYYFNGTGIMMTICTNDNASVPCHLHRKLYSPHVTTTHVIFYFILTRKMSFEFNCSLFKANNIIIHQFHFLIFISIYIVRFSIYLYCFSLNFLRSHHSNQYDQIIINHRGEHFIIIIDIHHHCYH